MVMMMMMMMMTKTTAATDRTVIARNRPRKSTSLYVKIQCVSIKQRDPGERVWCMAFSPATFVFFCSFQKNDEIIQKVM